MKKWSLILLAAGAAYWLWTHPAMTGPDDVSFSGVWLEEIVLEQRPPKQHVVHVLHVTADKKRFHVTQDTLDPKIGETIPGTYAYAYDGKNLRAKSGGVPANDLPPAGGQVMSGDRAESLRFWSRRMSSTLQLFPSKIGPGEKVADRPTDFYETHIGAGDTSSDLKVLRKWLDAKTGLVLKSEESSGNALFGTDSLKLECREIHYGPVDEAQFQNP